MFWPISKWFLFSSLCWEHKGIFLWYWLCKPGTASGSKIHTNIGAPWWPWVSFTWSLPMVSSSNLSTTVQVFLPWHWFPWRLLLWLVVILCIHLLVSPIWGRGEAVIFLCDITFFYGSKKNCWTFTLFSFLHRMEWWLPSSLYIRSEFKKQLNNWYCAKTI